MFFLYLEIAMLVLSILAVGCVATVLVMDDPEIMAWLKHNLSVDMKRYKHVARHSPPYIQAQKTREKMWYKQSLVFSAT